MQYVTRHARSRGFSLVELMIAMLIAVFLLGGLVVMVMGTRRASGTQNALSQLQDNERIAMTVITNIVQKAGYFPDPVGLALSSFTSETIGGASGVSMQLGQVVGGTHAAGVSDVFAVRFFTPPLDSSKGNAAINCAGQSNATTADHLVFNNMFLIGTVGTTSWLQCQTQTNNTLTSTITAGPTVNLIPNVTNIDVLYGVSVTPASTDYSVVQYLHADQMSNANWLNVTALKVTLTFQTPAYDTTGGQMSATTFTFKRVIPIMSRAGVQT